MLFRVSDTTENNTCRARQGPLRGLGWQGGTERLVSGSFQLEAPG